MPGHGAAKNPGQKTDYSIPAELFVRTWEQSATLDEVYDALKAHSETNGSPVMPKPIIVSRAAEYRGSKVPLKRMPRISSRNIDSKALTELVEQVRGEQKAELKAAPKAAKQGDEPLLTRKQVEEVVLEVLKKYRLVK